MKDNKFLAPPVNVINGSSSSMEFNGEMDSDEIPGYSGLMGYVGIVRSEETKNVTIIGTYPGYKLIREIGSGHFGKVYEAIRDSDGKYVALKVIKLNPSNPNALSDLKKEVAILTKISKPHCLSLIHI